jgi:homospermidine synthase
LTFGEVFKKKIAYWMNTGAGIFFTRSLKPVRNVSGVQATAICGLKPGAPALGF